MKVISLSLYWSHRQASSSKLVPVKERGLRFWANKTVPSAVFAPIPILARRSDDSTVAMDNLPLETERVLNLVRILAAANRTGALDIAREARPAATVWADPRPFLLDVGFVEERRCFFVI